MAIDNRSKKIVFISHCILNQNAKVMGLACCPGVIEDLVGVILRSEAGIVQMPCPEFAYLGLSRWGMTKEQYDTPCYRRHCSSLALEIVSSAAEYSRKGYRILGIVGIDGSPSCGVHSTWGGQGGGRTVNLAKPPLQRTISGEGIFIEEIDRLLKEYDLKIKKVGVPEPGKGDLKKSLNEVKLLFKN